MNLIVLVGLPGSGKSTWAASLKDHVVVCQDKVGNKRRCELMVAEALVRGRDVVVDRTNLTPAQRAVWVEIARFHGADVQAVFFDVPKDECARRVRERVGHETLGQDGHRVVYMMARSLTPPTVAEGFDDVFRHDDDLGRVMCTE